MVCWPCMAQYAVKYGKRMFKKKETSCLNFLIFFFNAFIWTSGKMTFTEIFLFAIVQVEPLSLRLTDSLIEGEVVTWPGEGMRRGWGGGVGIIRFNSVTSSVGAIEEEFIQKTEFIQFLAALAILHYRSIWRIGWLAPGWFDDRDEFILFFLLSWFNSSYS